MKTLLALLMLAWISSATAATPLFRIPINPIEYTGRVTCNYVRADGTFVRSFGTCVVVDIAAVDPELARRDPDLRTHVILTLAHVVANQPFVHVSVPGYDGEAQVINSSMRTDFAYLVVPEKVKLRPFPVFKLQGFSPLKLYTAYGINSKGDWQVSTGTIGTLSFHPSLNLMTGTFSGHASIPFSGPVAPGGSGGPVTDENGNLIGLINAGDSLGTGGTFLPWGASGDDDKSKDAAPVVLHLSFIRTEDWRSQAVLPYT